MFLKILNYLNNLGRGKIGYNSKYINNLFWLMKKGKNLWVSFI